MTTSENTIQATIILDSGSFLTDEEANGKTYSEVGYFTPHIAVYIDGEKKDDVLPGKLGTGCREIKVRKYDASGNEVATGITLSDCLLKYLLRLHTVYGHMVHPEKVKFDCIFQFNSGHFCSSKVKARNFREYNGKSHQETGQKKPVGEIAHDIAIHFELAPGETLKLMCDDNQIWSSGNLGSIRKRLDIEILADNSTAEMYYREGLKLMGQNYWLPNQGGDPPPNWVHGGPAGGGN